MKVEIEVGSIPDGFRAVAYRPIEKGEWFLGASEPILSTYGHSAPWLILEKIDQGEEPTSEQFWEYLIRNGWRPRLGGYWVHPNGRVTFSKSRCDIGDYIDEIAKVEGKDAAQVRAEMLTVSLEPPTGTIAQQFKPKQIDRPTVYYVRNKTTGNFLRRVDQKERNTLFVTEDQALAEHMAQGTEGGPYEVYPVTLRE